MLKTKARENYRSRDWLLKKNRETFSLTENKELIFVTFKKDNNTVTHSTHGLKLQQ